jgi:hypothetical protein
MKPETVLKCAQMAAASQMNAFGHVTQDVQDLIDELTAPVVEEAPVAKPKAKPKATAE